jgi:hypothetical protein
MGCGQSITRLPPERASVTWQRTHIHRNIAVLKPETPGLFCIAEIFHPHDARHSGCRQNACAPFGKHRYQPDVNHRSCIDRAGTSAHQRGPYYGEFSFVATPVGVCRSVKHSRVAYTRRTAFRDRQEASTHGKPISENSSVKEQTSADNVSTTRNAENSALCEPKRPFPQQHQRSPGLESELEPKPRYAAAQYEAAGKLQGKTALVTGGDSGIRRAVATLVAQEGADVTVAYLPDEQPDADETRIAIEGRASNGCWRRGISPMQSTAPSSLKPPCASSAGSTSWCRTRHIKPGRQIWKSSPTRSSTERSIPMSAPISGWPERR